MKPNPAHLTALYRVALIVLLSLILLKLWTGVKLDPSSEVYARQAGVWY